MSRMSIAGMLVALLAVAAVCHAQAQLATDSILMQMHSQHLTGAIVRSNHISDQVSWLDATSGVVCASEDEHVSGKYPCSNALLPGGMPFHNKNPKGDQSIVFDLGSIYIVSSFREHCHPDWTSGSAMNAFSLQVGESMSGPWVDVHKGSGSKSCAVDFAGNSFVVSPTSGRFWRLHFTNNFQSNYPITFQHIQFLGELPAATTTLVAGPMSTSFVESTTEASATTLDGDSTTASATTTLITQSTTSSAVTSTSKVQDEQVYRLNFAGTCESAGLEPVSDIQECREAARALLEQDSIQFPADQPSGGYEIADATKPGGCAVSVLDLQHVHFYAAAVGQCGSNMFLCVCKEVIDQSASAPFLAPVPTTPTAAPEPACMTCKPGDLCFKDVAWTMQHGFRVQPDWYISGEIDALSCFEDVQMFLYNRQQQDRSHWDGMLANPMPSPCWRQHQQNYIIADLLYCR